MGVSRKRATIFLMALGTNLIARERLGRRRGAAAQRPGPRRRASSLLGPGLVRLTLRVELQDRGTLAVAVLFALEPVVNGGQGDVGFHELGRFLDELFQLGAGLLRCCR